MTDEVETKGVTEDYFEYEADVICKQLDALKHSVRALGAAVGPRFEEHRALVLHLMKQLGDAQAERNRLLEKLNG